MHYIGDGRQTVESEPVIRNETPSSVVALFYQHLAILLEELSRALFPKLLPSYVVDPAQRPPITRNYPPEPPGSTHAAYVRPNMFVLGNTDRSYPR